jgi:hypothetical protein
VRKTACTDELRRHTVSLIRESKAQEGFMRESAKPIDRGPLVLFGARDRFAGECRLARSSAVVVVGLFFCLF